MVHLKYEEERLGKQYNEEEEEIDRLNDVIRHIQDICLSEKCSQLPAADVSLLGSDLMEPQMRLKQITERFHSLKRQFASEFVLYELHNLTVALVFPKVRSVINANPITLQQQFVSAFKWHTNKNGKFSMLVNFFKMHYSWGDVSTKLLVFKPIVQ